MSALDSAGASRSAITVGSDEQSKSAINLPGTDQPKGGCELSKFCGQATKGAWWMPWQKQAMKDVASCDKPRGAASRH
jgi:hypothetical protein